LEEEANQLDRDENYFHYHSVETQWRTQEFCLGGDSTNSVQDRGQREHGSGPVAP